MLTFAVQMDPIAGINIDTDSTFVVALEAQRRGHRLFYYLPQDLSWDEGRVVATGHDLTLRREPGDHFTLGPRRTVDLAAEVDVVLLRQDPPFNMAYITTTHLLGLLPPHVLVVNDAAGVRNSPEKLLVLDYPQLAPPTLISADRSRIEAFRARHGDIVIKPLFGNGGFGVFHLRPDDENLGTVLDVLDRLSPAEPLVVQAYLPAIREGDKRIILVDGEPVGMVNRVPVEGDARANLHVGGSAERAQLSPRDREICAAIGPRLRALGMIFTGIDIIGEHLIEINVTSPTCIQEINALDGAHLEGLVVDAIERASARRRAA